MGSQVLVTITSPFREDKAAVYAEIVVEGNADAE